ncbi:hypothetical protein M3Y98_00717500 [Aphelenchoides besseyi]|nr:hypothetical protein M3Y98_00717500 [Aphelenchoides besseyi]
MFKVQNSIRSFGRVLHTKALAMAQANTIKSELLVIGELTKENCELASKLNRSPWILGVTYLKTKAIRRAVGLMSVNLKLICVVGIFYYFWGFACAILVSMYRLYEYARHAQPCDFVWSGSFCYTIYSQHTSTCIAGYTLFHVALLVERIHASFFNSVCSRPSMFGIVIALSMLVIPQISVILYFKNYVKEGLLYDRVYCSGPIFNTVEVNANVLQTAFSLLSFDVLVTIGDLCLLLYNKHQLARYYRRISDTYTLAKSFSLHGAQISIRLITPFSIAQSVSYSTVFLIYIFYILRVPTFTTEMDQFWRDFGLLTTSFYFLFFVLYTKKERANEWMRNENEADRYFQQFNQMIS